MINSIYCIILLCVCHTRVNANNIAVVEYAPVRSGPSDAVNTRLNFAEYEKILDQIKLKEIDLVIFPESTLNSKATAIEILIDRTCYEEPVCPDQLLNSFSAAVNSTNSYIVINLTEKEKCEDSDNSTENCKTFGFHYYNTDVIFDRQGRIMRKYRKYNLFGEYDIDQPTKPDQVIIETDFRLRMGIFTCFDILFKIPAQDLVDHDVDAVIFPSMWFSELPFLTSLQTQQMWAHTHNTSLLAAGANRPEVGSGGSGFYQGSSGAKSNGIVTAGGNKIFYSDDVKPNEDVDELGKAMDGFYLKTDKSLLEYSSTVLNTSTSRNDSVHGKCVGLAEICCTFRISFEAVKPKPNKHFYTYHLVAYSGVRSFDGVYNGGIEVCGVIACLNESLSSCGHRFPDYTEIDWPVTFTELRISADFKNNDNRTQYPNSLLSSIRPIEPSKTTWKKLPAGDGVIERVFSINENQDRLLTFAIYGRMFDKDFPPDNNAALRILELRYSMLLSCFVLYLGLSQFA